MKKVALSGSFTGTTNNQHVQPKITWSATQNIAENYSMVTATLTYSRTNSGYTTSGRWNGSITINGTTISGASDGQIFITQNSNTFAMETTVKVTHDGDGSKSIAISCTGTIPGASLTSTTCSSTVTLDTIPRASEPTLSSTNFTVGDAVRLNTNRKSTAFTHSLYFLLNDGSYREVATGITDGVDIASNSTITSLLYSESTNSKKREGKFLLRTFNGSSNLGDKDVAFTATIPENSSTKPTVTMSISPYYPDGKPRWLETDYVQGKSQVKAEMTASAQMGADIKSYNVTVDGKTTTLATNSESEAVTTQVLNNSGLLTVVGKSIDTRDIPSEEKTDDITVIPYGKPFITSNSAYGNIVCARYDAENEVMADNGTSLKLIVGVKWYSLSNKENTAVFEVRCVSKTTDSGWIPLEVTDQGGGPENNYISYYGVNMVVPNLTVAVDKTYWVYLRCTDKFGECNSDSEKIYFKIPTEDVCLNLGKYGNKAAFGKYAEDDKTLEIAPEWDLKLKGHKMVAHPIEEGTDGIWTYKKWSDGTYEATYLHGEESPETITLAYECGAIYLSGTQGTHLSPPSFNKKITHYEGVGSVVSNYSGLFIWLTSETIGWRMWSPLQITNDKYRLSIKIEGTWEIKEEK